MKKLSFFFAVISALISIFSFVGCGAGGSAIDLRYFNTAVHIETHDKPLSDATISSVNALLSQLQNEFDEKNSQSVTYKLNSNAENQSFLLSNHGANVFSIAKECYEFTNGLFDPTIYPIVKLWGFNDYPVSNFIIPTQNQIDDTLNLVGFDKVVFEKENLQVKKTQPNTELAFGGILKGYASEKVMQILKDAGHTSGYVNIGGSSLNLLSVSSLAIRHPRANGNLQNIISINTKNLSFVSVSTSGDYERYYVSDGKLYSHLISPIDGKPTSSGITSATLICDDGAFADAVTTAICLLDHNAENTDLSPLVSFLHKVINRYQGAQIYVVYENDGIKQIISNKVQGEDFTLLDTTYAVVKI